MATVHWTSGSGGNWSDSLDWSGGAVPASTDDVVVDAVATGAGGYTVTVDGDDTANSLSVIAAATVQISASETLTLAAATGTGANAGTIAIADKSELLVSGTMDNTGLIAVQGGADATSLSVMGSALDLTGGGAVALVDAGQSSQIAAAAAGNMLVNTDNTISGAGVIGVGGLAVDNQSGGVIDANDADRLTLDTTGSFTNEGLLAATGVGGLEIAAGTTIDNTGTILANGGTVYLDGAVSGGTLSASSGSIDVETGSTATLTDATLTTASPLAVSAGGTLNLQGTLTNQGTLVVGAVPPGPLFVPDSTFQAEGSGSPDDFTTTVTLTPGTTTLDNGTVDLTIALVPDGTSEWLVFTYNTTNGAPLSSGGDWSINQVGLDAAQSLNFGAAFSEFISNGTVETPASSVFPGYNVVSSPVPGVTGFGLGGGGFVDPITPGPISALGSYIDPWSQLDYYGVDSSATTGYLQALEFSPGAATTATQLLVSTATATLSGGGVVELVDNGTLDSIGSTSYGNQLVNVDNVIAGAGAIGTGGLAFDNQAGGIIDASATDPLVIDTDGEAASNEGFIEATGGGGLQITGGTVISNTGTILADGGNIHLDNASIFGGTLSGPSGSFIVDANDDATLSGASIAAGTQLTVSNAATLDISATVVDAGVVDVTGSNAVLMIGSPVEQALDAPLANGGIGATSHTYEAALTLPPATSHASL